MKSHRLIVRSCAVATLSGFMMGLHSALFSPDGHRLATGSSGFEAVKLWDVESHENLLTLEGRGSGLHRTAFSPDGSILGTKNFAGGLNLWRAPSWAEIEQAERKAGATITRADPSFAPETRRAEEITPAKRSATANQQ